MKTITILNHYISKSLECNTNKRIANKIEISKTAFLKSTGYICYEIVNISTYF
jgi:hypothetical protein